MSEGGTPSRLFTVDEANALLPAIRPAVEELLETFKEIRAEIEQATTLSGPPAASDQLPKRLEERGVAPRLFEKVRTIIDRIHARGCLVNGPEAGLVDFPCLYGSEIVFLCWKFGEPRVAHWHRIPDGFAGRRPLLDASDMEAARVH
ncbi:MAG TPA: DUF2203 domain-containing protein [Candidatus Polarisedimenticolia bacterium]|nr:DUF2203 domain-containing protein [Candidatus Polarisedimenticolia bacterium]